jgi:hypothetical protein
MKKFIYSAAMLLTGFAVQAQLNSGNIFLGGAVEFSTSKDKFYAPNATVDGNVRSSVLLAPSVGYMLSDNLAIGVTAGFGKNTTDFANGNVRTTNTFGIAPFVRKYWGLNDAFYIFGEGSLGFGTGTQKFRSGGTTVTEREFNIFQIAVAPGLAFFPSPKFALEFKFNLLSYTKDTEVDPDDSRFKDTTTTISFGTNTFAPSIGVYYFLGK